MKNAWNAQGRIDMDERITPRSFAAGLPGDIPRHWLPGNEFVSSLLNAYTILVPANEAFYIRTLNACLPHVRDETLLGRCVSVRPRHLPCRSDQAHSHAP